MDLPRRMAYSLVAVMIIIQTVSVSTETKVKRNDGVEIASTLGLTFQSVEPTEADDKNEASDEAVQHHEFQRMAVLQNLNYMDDVITNLETERTNLERLWKSTTAPGESQLQRAAKSLWQKTVKQLAVLHQKKLELVETLKSITFDENSSQPTPSDDKKPVNVSSTTPKSATKEGASNLSKAICQFFVFGTLFGIVVTITICTCFLQPKQHRRRRHRVASISMNPSRIPEPFDYSKPCLLRADASGRFYASPLDSDEIPPLPTYEAALALPRSPSESTPAPSFEDVTTLQSIAVVTTPAPDARDARY